MAKFTQLQENFCQGIVDGLNQTDAYKAAGYSFKNKQPDTVYQAASRLAAESKVVARIQELRDKVTAGKAWTFEQGMNQIETNIDLARRDKQHGAARASTRDAIELSGLLDRPQGPPDVKITKVTVVLNHGKRDNLDDEPAAIEGVTRELPSADETE